MGEGEKSYWVKSWLLKDAQLKKSNYAGAWRVAEIGETYPKVFLSMDF